MAESPTCMGALGSACHQLSQETAPITTRSGEPAGKHAAGQGRAHTGAQQCQSLPAPSLQAEGDALGTTGAA